MHVGLLVNVPAAAVLVGLALRHLRVAEEAWGGGGGGRAGGSDSLSVRWLAGESLRIPNSDRSTCHLPQSESGGRSRLPWLGAGGGGAGRRHEKRAVARAADSAASRAAALVTDDDTTGDASEWRRHVRAPEVEAAWEQFSHRCERAPCR